MPHKLVIGLGALVCALLLAWAMHAVSVEVDATRINQSSPTTANEMAARSHPTATATRAHPTASPTRPQPTATPTTRPEPVRPTPTPAASTTLNGVPVSNILILSPSVKQHLVQIYAKGQALGRDPRAFSKIGDSTMVWPPFMALFDDPTAYSLGPFQYLQETIDNYPGSFAHISAAAKKSMHTWTEFDPEWVNNPRCKTGEEPLACELRINNPSIVFIRLGANDVSNPTYYAQQLKRIVEACLNHGVIPVLGTKPDRLEGPDNTLNRLVAQIATAFQIPLWDYDLIAGTVPGKGLMYDHVHFKANGSHDYGSPEAFQAADSLEDLTGLMMLDTITRLVKPAALQK